MTVITRENPKQNRANRTVDYIAEATVQVFDIDQSPTFTTNHIAKRAGVSIGTLYRYFPDKKALLRFVVRREMHKTSAVLFDAIDNADTQCPEALVNRVCEICTNSFDTRLRAMRNIRALAEQDAALAPEIMSLRENVIRRLHERLMALAPHNYAPMSDAELKAICAALPAALTALEKANANQVPHYQARAKIVRALLSTFPGTMNAS